MDNQDDNEPQAVEIKPHQVEHFQRIVDILSREYSCIDVSPFGAGKTHIMFAVAATFGLNMGIVAPKSTINNWKKWAKIYGINIVFIITYQKLRGQECYDLRHGLLTRVEGEYQTTDLFDQCVKSNLLLVFDEFHNLKNDNTQLASAHALVKGLVRLVRAGHTARIALLSATPCETRESVTSVLKMAGIILSDKLHEYNKSSKEYILVGIQEAIDKCRRYDPDETLAITCRPVNKASSKTICYELYSRILKKYIVSSMPPPPIDAEKISRNYYILMPDNDVERLKNGLLLFKSATNYRHETQEVDLSGTNWGDVTTSRMEIDSAKIDSVCRLAMNDLHENENCKVIIYCNYTRDTERAYHLLGRYSPLILTGSATEKQRIDIIGKFQEDSNTYRVMIATLKVGGVGIDLDDKYGSRPRIMYILPSYFFTDQLQSTGRIHRIGTESTATVYFVYSRAFPYETGILNSMANKSQVVRNMVTKEHSTIKLPGEYEELVELTPEEIRTGVTINMDQSNLLDIIYEKPVDPTCFTPSDKPNKDLTPAIPKSTNISFKLIREKLSDLRNRIERSPLEDDKYQAFLYFIDFVDSAFYNKDEPNGPNGLAEIVRKTCDLIYDNIKIRLGRDDIYKAEVCNNEVDLVNYVETFLI